MSNFQNIQRVSLQPAYILHSRAYRDSSLILDVLTPAYGRVALLAKGAKKPQSSRRAVLQPFRSLLLSWQGRGELQTLTKVEESGRTLALQEERLICGYYVNELLHRLLSHSDGDAELFVLYDDTLNALEETKNPELPLRQFEVRMLQNLGLFPDLNYCADTGDAVESDKYYNYVPDIGVLADDAGRDGQLRMSGRALLALQANTLDDREALNQSKLLMRSTLHYHLGDKPIHSRELFRLYAEKLKRD